LTFHAPVPQPILILTQGHAGDRLGAQLVPALREQFPDRELTGIGGQGMLDAGVQLLTRADGISAMGWTGLLPKVPAVFRAVLQTARGSRSPLPGCVVAVDVWQPLKALHRFGPHLREIPHVCYLPPGPNFIGVSRVHHAAARFFAAIVTPFPHQARLFRGAGGNVVLAAHAGLLACRREAQPLPAGDREPLLAVLPGSRELEIRYSLDAQLAAAESIRREHPELEPVVCCASDAVEKAVRRRHPSVRTSRQTRDVLARARFGLICSGTAVLEAAVLGCPGVVTYHGSPLQRWEWHRFHVPGLARLRAAGIASPYISLPNIIAGEELYPEMLDSPPADIASAALTGLAGDLASKRQALDRVSGTLSWDDPGHAVAEEVRNALSRG
jgi:lipid-A-disaccharide synthase